MRFPSTVFQFNGATDKKSRARVISYFAKNRMTIKMPILRRCVGTMQLSSLVLGDLSSLVLEGGTDLRHKVQGMILSSWLRRSCKEL